MQQQHGQQQQGQHSTEAAPTPASGIDMLAAASHLALLQPTSGEGAAALRRLAMPWPGAFAPVQQGQLVTAVGAPFGALAPQHFAGFLAGGVVSAAVPASSSAAGGGSSSAAGPALLLADLRCSPGREGGPVYAAAPTAVAAPLQAASSQQQQQPQQPQLTGMLLPPLKAPQAGLEFALVAPAAAVLAAVDALLSRTSSSSPAADGPTSTAEAAAWAPAALAAALPSVVAVTAGGSWASGVVVSSAGHILTNAHLLQPPTPLLSPADSRRGPGQLSVHPAAPPPPDAHPPVQVLLPAAGGTSTPGAGSSWQTADVLYVFQGPLD